jgi:phosphatidylglycerol:prolipoprotein diacylglycerol transferase
VFPPESHAGSVYPGVALHPAQLYASAVGFGLMGLLLVVDRRRLPKGSLFLLFLVLYSVARILLDLVRTYDAMAYPVAGVPLTLNQWISIGVIAFAGYRLVRGPRRAAA